MSKQAPISAGVIALVGSDRFIRQEELARVLSSMTDMDEVGPSLFTGSDAALSDVLDEVRTASLLGGRRVVILDDADAFITANRAALERYCEAPATSGCMILLCDRMPRNTRLYKILAKGQLVIHCEPPSARELSGWVSQRASTKYGKQLARDAAFELCRLAGESPGLLDTELAKLSAFVGSRPQITKADIDELIGQHREEKVFAVTDAIASGDAATALALWEQVLATDRAAPGRALAGLAWSVRRLLQARRDYDRGASPQQLARQMFTDPGTLHRRLERASVDRLEAQLSDLLHADLAIKTGLGTINVAVEKFIVKHTQGAASAVATA